MGLRLNDDEETGQCDKRDSRATDAASHSSLLLLLLLLPDMYLASREQRVHLPYFVYSTLSSCLGLGLTLLKLLCISSGDEIVSEFVTE